MKSNTELFVDCMASILEAHDVGKSVMAGSNTSVSEATARKLLKHCRAATAAAQTLERRAAGCEPPKEG